MTLYLASDPHDPTKSLALGDGALAAAGPDVTRCIAIGPDALANVAGPTDGFVAIGSNALRSAESTITGRYNVAVGDNAGHSVTTGWDCVAVGGQALKSLTTGVDNVAVGCYAMHDAVTGTHNVAVGESALYENLSGSRNVAIGDGAGHALQSDENCAIGAGALIAPGGINANKTTEGARNTALGTRTGQASSAQRNNTVVVGYQALVDGDYAVALGADTLAGAPGAVAIGTDSDGAGATTIAQDQIMLGTPKHTVRILGALKTKVITTEVTDDLDIHGNGAINDVRLNVVNGRDVLVGKKLRLMSSGPALGFDHAGQEQLTVGPAGIAAAPPSAPAKYFKVLDSTGAVLLIPGYPPA